MARDNRKRYTPKPNITDRVRLATLLTVIERMDQVGDYEIRNRAVLTALSLALALGYKGGIRTDEDMPDYPVVLIELPTGQVSWHLPQFDREWDGHTTEEKYERIHAFVSPIIRRSA